MADQQMRPASKKDAPNPAHSYERTDPNRESGMGKTGQPQTPPHQEPDKMRGAVPNRQDPTRQINAEDTNQPDHPGGKGGTPDAGEPRRNG